MENISRGRVSSILTRPRPFYIRIFLHLSLLKNHTVIRSVELILAEHELIGEVVLAILTECAGTGQYCIVLTFVVLCHKNRLLSDFYVKSAEADYP